MFLNLRGDLILKKNPPQLIQKIHSEPKRVEKEREQNERAKPRRGPLLLDAYRKPHKAFPLSNTIPARQPPALFSLHLPPSSSFAPSSPSRPPSLLPRHSS